MKSYKPVELAPSKGKLRQKPHKMKETPQLKGMSYEKPRKGTRS